MISGGWLVGILDSDPAEDTTEAAGSATGLLNKPRKEGRLGNFLTTFSVFTSGGGMFPMISGGRLVGILDSDPATEDTTEPASSSVPGLNHPCFLGFFKFTSIFFRFSSFGTVFLFLALPAAAEEFPVYNEKGHAGK